MDKIKYLNYSLNDTSKVIKLWDNEVGYIFPITKQMMEQNINNSKHFRFDISFVAYEGNKLVGFILGKIYNNDPVISKYVNTGWISLIYVARNYRKQGIGSILLDMLEKKMKENNISKIAIGSDIDNFFPGIPNDFDNLTDVFFRNRGYNVSYYTHDLVKKICKSDLTNFNKYIEDNNILNKIKIRYATIEDKDKVFAFFEKCFYGRWFYEVKEYFNDNQIKEEYVIALDGEKVVGFLRLNKQLIDYISYNIMWAGRFKKLIGFGPLGVDQEYRKHGIATYLLMFALKESYEGKFSEAMIDWTGLVTYYQKFGFEIWKCYQYANKELNK